MKTKIECALYPKARIGQNYLSRIQDHLEKQDSKIMFVYSFETHELLITDESLIEVLDFLKIPYKLVEPTQSITYIKEE